MEFELDAAADIVGLETAAPPDMFWFGTVGVELDAGFSLMVGDALAPEPSILPLSLAQPPTISPRNIIQIVCLSIKVPPVDGFPQTNQLRTRSTRRWIVGETPKSMGGKH